MKLCEPNKGKCCRDECSKLRGELEEKTKDVDLVVCENAEIRRQYEEMTLKAKNAEAENKVLIDRWMLQKMQDAERLNEVYSLCSMLHLGGT